MNIYRILSILFFALLIAGLYSLDSYQEEPIIQKTSKADQIEGLINLYADYGGFNGTALIADQGKVIYKGGYGMANMEWNIPNEVDTKFQIGSLTKSFTSMLSMQLVSEGRLDLHQPISAYILDYPKGTGDLITAHHLLTHTSGIPNVNSKEKKFRPKELVDQFAHLPLLFDPGDRFDYSNSGYTLLGYILETITEQSYEELLKERILDPLNMSHSGFYRHRPIIKKLSSGYYKGFGDYFDMDYSDRSSAYAAGGIYSTVEDLNIWTQVLYRDTLLTKEFRALMLHEHIEDHEYKCHYGYGWELMDKPAGNSDRQIKTIGHGGSIGGFKSSMIYIPQTQSSIILLSNTNYTFINAITKAILGILHDEPYSLPLKPLALFMSRVIDESGIDEGISFYKEHSKSEEYYTSEQELIVAGYERLHKGKIKEAAKIFKLSIDQFPDRDNPYDSYAEALMQLGEYKAAIENYNMSLSLNPNNKNAIRMLKKNNKLIQN